eukprot:Gb_21244 [translate_table: standard]
MLGMVEPRRSITIGNSCIWDRFIFLATGIRGDYMEMLLDCLRNPGYRLGIVTGCSGFVADGAPFVCKLVLTVRVFVTVCGLERKTTVGYGEETLAYLYGVEMQVVGGNLWFQATNENGVCGGVVAVRDSRRNGPRAMGSYGNGGSMP